MAIKDEFPRGQISTIILMCLAETDKYGYEIIDEVLKKTNGKLSIKQPSLYSSLKRMEEQSLISSYWRDSEIGGRRHYYHLTDLGRKHLEKWRNNINLEDLSTNNNQELPNNELQTRVLQQESLFNISKQNEITFLEKINDVKENNNTYVQFDLFTKDPIIAPACENNTIENQISFEDKTLKNEIIKPVIEQKPIMTSYEKQDVSPTIQKFEYIKKTNSFSDSIINTTSFSEKKYIEKFDNIVKQDNQLNVYNNAETQNQEVLLKKVDLNSLEGYIFSEKANLNNANLNEIVKAKDNNGAGEEETVQELKEESIINIEENTNQTIDNSPFNADNFDNQTNNAEIQNATQNEEVKDDGVIITERLDIKDLPKPAKWENRRFEIYLSDNSISPKLVSKKDERYEDRIKDLYEKSKTNAENQELELIDSKIQFTSYKELQQFYSEQNIKFKPYQKSLYKSDKSFDMIRITKLNLLTNLCLLSIYSIISVILAISFSFVKVAKLNNAIFYVTIPFIFVITTAVALIQFVKSPRKKVAYDVNKFKFNISLFFINLLIIPLIIAVNVLFGFNFSNFPIYSLTILYPIIMATFYLFYYVCQKIFIKRKMLY